MITAPPIPKVETETGSKTKTGADVVLTTAARWQFPKPNQLRESPGEAC
jgi:hypothetical protein